MKLISLLNSSNTSVLNKLAILLKRILHTEFDTKQIVIFYDSL